MHQCYSLAAIGGDIGTVARCLSNSFIRTLKYPELCPEFLKQLIPNC